MMENLQTFTTKKTYISYQVWLTFNMLLFNPMLPEIVVLAGVLFSEMSLHP